MKVDDAKKFVSQADATVLANTHNPDPGYSCRAHHDNKTAGRRGL